MGALLQETVKVLGAVKGGRKVDKKGRRDPGTQNAASLTLEGSPPDASFVYNGALR